MKRLCVDNQSFVLLGFMKIGASSTKKKFLKKMTKSYNSRKNPRLYITSIINGATTGVLVYGIAPFGTGSATSSFFYHKYCLNFKYILICKNIQNSDGKKWEYCVVIISSWQEDSIRFIMLFWGRDKVTNWPVTHVVNILVCWLSIAPRWFSCVCFSTRCEKPQTAVSEAMR